jgi:hypothetical protein
MNIVNTRVRKINGKIETTIHYDNDIKEVRTFDTLEQHFEYCKAVNKAADDVKEISALYKMITSKAEVSVL